jgi:hypothetical protein
MNTIGGGQFDKDKGTYTYDLENDKETYGKTAGGFTVASINSTDTDHPDFRGAAASVQPPKRYVRANNYGPKGENFWDKAQQVYHPEDINRDKNGKEVSRQEALTIEVPPVLTDTGATHNYIPETKRATATAIAESKKRYGRTPWASNNTSEYSTPAVNKAIEAGILGGIEGRSSKVAKVGNFSDMEFGAATARVAASNIKLSKSRNAGFKSKKIRNAEVEKNVADVDDQMRAHVRKKLNIEPAPQKKKAPKTKKKSYVQETLDFGDN